MSTSADEVRPIEDVRRALRVSGIALGVLALAAVLGLLYLGRSILVPVTLAILLCFGLSPLVRRLRLLGFGHASSVLSAVAISVLVVSSLAVSIGMHAMQVTANLPTYQATIEKNLRSLRSPRLSSLEQIWDAAQRLLDPSRPAGVDVDLPSDALVPRAGNGPIAVDVLPPKPAPMERLQRLLSMVWGPVGSAGIVFIVLIFVLLERESLRDRFIRLVGGGDLRATTSAINDAGERLARYLARQFAVNIGFGLVIWIVLLGIGLPEAALVAATTVVLRFVPYVGAGVAAMFAMLLALGAADGWTLVLWTGTAFLAIDLITSHVIEPRVYGQATGLSPLSIVLAALFWGWLWGPVGVIIATPLTLCLAVAGRHAESLGFLDVALGDGPALTMAQKFYQRALSGDSDEIIAGARHYLRRRSFATYCDAVLVPALQLGRADFVKGQITLREQEQLRVSIVRVIEALDGAKRNPGVIPPRMTVLQEASSGRVLRQRRMLRQGAAAAGGPGSKAVVLCVGLGGPGDDLATEVLVRILRGLGLDARDLAAEDSDPSRRLLYTASDIGAFCLVTMTGGEGSDAGDRLTRELCLKSPDAAMFALMLPGVYDASAPVGSCKSVDRVVNSYEQAVLELQARVRHGRPTTVAERPVDSAPGVSKGGAAL